MDITTLKDAAKGKESPPRAVMFADLSGSTRLYELLGDAAAKELITRSLQKLAEAVTANEGRVIKTIGDELLCVFNSAHEAIMAARQMVRESTEFVPDVPRAPGRMLQLRVGVHFGSVIEDAGDIFGDTVNTAARVVSLAKPNTIMVSDALRDALPLSLRALLEFHDTVVVKGKSKPLDIYEVITGAVDHEETQNMTRALEYTTDLATLTLCSGALGVSVEVSRTNPTVTIGRGPHNDVVVRSTLVSREHARIDYKHGKFYVTDFSNNGTCITLSDGTRTLIRKSDYRLIFSGALYFGEEPSPKAQTGIEFSIGPTRG